MSREFKDIYSVLLDLGVCKEQALSSGLITLGEYNVIAKGLGESIKLVEFIAPPSRPLVKVRYRRLGDVK